MICLHCVSRLRTSIGAKENAESGKNVLIMTKYSMLNYNYGVAQSLNYAVARISTTKAKSSRIKTYGVTHISNYAVTIPCLREIPTYEDYAVTNY